MIDEIIHFMPLEILEIYSQKKPSLNFFDWCVFCCTWSWGLIIPKVG